MSECVKNSSSSIGYVKELWVWDLEFLIYVSYFVVLCDYCKYVESNFKFIWSDVGFLKVVD